MLGRKDAIVTKMTKGVEFLFRKNKITWLKGHGKLTGMAGERVQLQVLAEAGGDGAAAPAGAGSRQARQCSARHVIIATGSKARHLPFATVDNVLVADNEGALASTRCRRS